MSKQNVRTFLIALVSLILVVGFTIITIATFAEVTYVMAHPGTPGEDSDGDGVEDNLDSCWNVAGEAWYGGCPWTPGAPPTEAVQPTAIPPTATPNPVTARNFQAADRETITAALNAGDTVIVEEAATLESFAGSPQEIIAELQTAAAFEGQGYIAAQQSYLFLNGRGDLFVAVGANVPSSDVVIGGEMTFTSDGTQFELCSLAARVNRDGLRNAQTLLDLALVNDGSVALIDRSDASAPAVITAVDLDLDLSVSHRLLMIVTGETVDVYVDGVSVMDDITVTAREGVYGMSMVGRAEARPRCEVRNFWVYTF